MLAHVFDRLSPEGPGARLSVLIFHRVLAAPDPLFPSEVDAARFDRICGWVRTWFNVLPLDEAAVRLVEGRLPRRALAITFDDGYRDNHDIALPILQRHGLPATFFIATGFLDGGRMWNDRIVEAIRRTDRSSLALDALPDATALAVEGPLGLASTEDRRQAVERLLPQVKYMAPARRLAFADAFAAALGPPDGVELMMRSTEVQALRRAGMQIGAHTVSHPILATLDAEDATAELVASRTALEALLDEPVTLFAYPNGKPGDDFTAATVELVRRAGFQAAVSTAWGAAGSGADPWQLPRFTPWNRSRLPFAARLASNLRRPAAAIAESAR